MLLNPGQIKKNIDWLIENASAPVRYLTYLHLLEMPAEAGPMPALWQAVENSPEVQEIFSKQEADGSWYAGGSWALAPSYMSKAGWDPYNPKYVTAVWVLPFLGEMGFTVQDGRVRKACDYVLSHGYFRDPVFDQPLEVVPPAQVNVSPCRFAQYLIALSAVGLAQDTKVRKGYQVLLSFQGEDGGWVLPQHFEGRGWTRSCPFSSYHAVMALYTAADAAYRPALTRGLEFLAWHLSTKSEFELQRFFYHGHSMVHELQAFAELGVGLEEGGVKSVLAWLMSLYDAGRGCFHYSGKPPWRYSLREDGLDARVAKYRLHHLVEDDWLTYRMTKIGCQLSGTSSYLEELRSES